jgi:hypothetical protein
MACPSAGWCCVNNCETLSRMFVINERREFTLRGIWPRPYILLIMGPIREFGRIPYHFLYSWLWVQEGNLAETLYSFDLGPKKGIWSIPFYPDRLTKQNFEFHILTLAVRPRAGPRQDGRNFCRSCARCQRDFVQDWYFVTWTPILNSLLLLMIWILSGPWIERHYIIDRSQL